MKAADMFRPERPRGAGDRRLERARRTQFAKALADNGAAVALVARRADRLAA